MKRLYIEVDTCVPKKYSKYKDLSGLNDNVLVCSLLDNVRPACIFTDSENMSCVDDAYLVLEGIGSQYAHIIIKVKRFHNDGCYWVLASDLESKTSTFNK